MRAGDGYHRLVVVAIVVAVIMILIALLSMVVEW